MDEDKVETVRNWSSKKKTKDGRLNNLFEVQQCLGFCNYYRRCVPKYSEREVPLTKLTKRDEPFVWEAEQQLAFETMVTAFTRAAVLQHFEHEREVIIKTDDSDYVSAGVLSQYDNEGVSHPVAHFSKNHTPAKCNYDIDDKKLMVNIMAPEECRPKCTGAAYPLQLLTDHENLEYDMTKKLMNRQQARWSEFSTRFDYQIVDRTGKCHGKADALMRRVGDPPEGGDEILKNMEQVVLKSQNLSEQLCLLVESLPAQEWCQQPVRATRQLSGCGP